MRHATVTFSLLLAFAAACVARPIPLQVRLERLSAHPNYREMLSRHFGPAKNQKFYVLISFAKDGKPTWIQDYLADAEHVSRTRYIWDWATQGGSSNAGIADEDRKMIARLVRLTKDEENPLDLRSLLLVTVCQDGKRTTRAYAQDRLPKVIEGIRNFVSSLGLSNSKSLADCLKAVGEPG